ncbi:YczE/YyaS/YitT family protein [Corynebacterium sp. S7]
MDQSKNKKRGANVIVRLIISVIGVTIMMGGVALVTLAGLGTSPISAVIWVLTLNGGLSFGGWTAVWNVLLILIQLLILRGRFPKSGWWQLAALAVSSGTLDTWMNLFSWVETDNYVLQLVTLFVGIFMLALGVSISVVPKLLFMPGEGLVVAVSTVTGWDFSKVKIGNDISLVVLAVLLSLILFGNIQGIREGTVIAAFMIGTVVGWVTPTVKRVVAKLVPDE